MIKNTLYVIITMRGVKKMITTSSYNNWQSDKYLTYSISGDRGRNANYHGRCYPKWKNIYRRE